MAARKLTARCARRAENLRSRFQAEAAQRYIYTYTGHILIACNPFQRMDGLYSDEVKEQYKRRPLGAEPPHTFALADRAYRLCVVDKADQAIVVIGESGACTARPSKRRHVVTHPLPSDSRSHAPA